MNIWQKTVILLSLISVSVFSVDGLSALKVIENGKDVFMVYEFSQSTVQSTYKVAEAENGTYLSVPRLNVQGTHIAYIIGNDNNSWFSVNILQSQVPRASGDWSSKELIRFDEPPKLSINGARIPWLVWPQGRKLWYGKKSNSEIWQIDIDDPSQNKHVMTFEFKQNNGDHEDGLDTRGMEYFNFTYDLKVAVGYDGLSLSFRPLAISGTGAQPPEPYLLQRMTPWNEGGDLIHHNCGANIAASGAFFRHNEVHGYPDAAACGHHGIHGFRSRDAQTDQFEDSYFYVASPNDYGGCDYGGFTTGHSPSAVNSDKWILCHLGYNFKDSKNTRRMWNWDTKDYFNIITTNNGDLKLREGDVWISSPESDIIPDLLDDVRNRDDFVIPGLDGTVRNRMHRFSQRKNDANIDVIRSNGDIKAIIGSNSAHSIRYVVQDAAGRTFAKGISNKESIESVTLRKGVNIIVLNDSHGKQLSKKIIVP